ncbi:MltA domain-containing protein [Rhodoblastus acidophilus]|uniref:peptidoglycan lytic exotransglycosylase n=1 Tax=Candidatus Rhodoblastus alkanivorans TaxID=2954117 RepID=A0ABS9Z1K1_9HYPH|nr:MltA domain-containing protein [Candidatus Rhodoblastus alkanivorans]MCI4678124.1 MltA domain-containing protein [Candidatus Rhodoblastus alkanivorans]MCI4681535.1 MltA domain-containing protein [Candidatus Rhodoblastus alkanivorans]MDI4642583.1 MltA domain-containing protein [Rhodoblastus acidophilus]
MSGTRPQNFFVCVRRHALALACFLGGALAPGALRCETPAYRLQPASFADLPGFAQDRLAEALKIFAKTCDRPLRASVHVEKFDRKAQAEVCGAVRNGEGRTNALAFFQRRFQPFRIVANASGDAFFTGYYQPEIAGSLAPSAAFPTPVYGVPPDLVVLPPGKRTGALAGLTAARRELNGALAPFPDRAAIEDGALEQARVVRKLVYLRDNVDLFLAQVQGSARVRLTDGRVLLLTFAGRNGQPYTALARVLVQRGITTPSEMTMTRLTAWIRAHGVGRGQPGDDLLRLNRSFVFFNARIEKGPESQPRGGSGSALTPLRSIAVDKHVWPYGLPFFIDSAMPWRSAAPEPFRRVVVAQDTGSAIVGPARADIYFGLGDLVGARAAEIRHHGQFFILLPIPNRDRIEP